MHNRVSLIGNLGQDPEFRTLEGGTAVCRMSVATNESWKDRDGNWQTETQWHNVVAWRDLAERIADRLHKGSQVFVEGKINYRKYQDKEGVERYDTDIVASTVRSLEKAATDRDARNFPAAPPAKYEVGTAADPQYTAPTAAAPAAVAPQAGDDLPF